MLSLVVNVCVSFFNCQLNFIFSIYDLVVSGSESRKGIDPKSPIRDVSKSYFLDFNKKEVENVDKGNQRVNKHVEL